MSSSQLCAEDKELLLLLSGLVHLFALLFFSFFFRPCVPRERKKKMTQCFLDDLRHSLFFLPLLRLFVLPFHRKKKQSKEGTKGKKKNNKARRIMAAPLPDLTAVLVSAQSPDAGIRQQAEAALEHLRATQPAAYLAALAAELGGENKPAEARQIAGLILKNALDAPSEVKKVRLNVKDDAREGGKGERKRKRQ